MSLFERARFNFMHFMPYIHLPEDQETYPSVWVDFPNRLYDPARGTQLYQRYLSEFVLADRLGYDAPVVKEHHSSAYGMMSGSASISSSSRDMLTDQDRLLITSARTKTLPIGRPWSVR